MTSTVDVAVEPAAAADAPAALPPSTPWQATYASVLVVVDCVAVFIALSGGLLLRFGLASDASLDGVSYGAVALVAGPLWITTLSLHRAYEARVIGTGATEFRRVFLASLRLAGAVAIVCYLFKLDLARGFVAYVVPLGVALLLLGRYAARRWVHRRRQSGQWSLRVLVVGDRAHAEELVRVVHAQPHVGLRVVGACIAGGVGARSFLPSGIPVVGSLADASAVARRLGVDDVAVTASPGITGRALRRLAWELEGTGIDMVVAPSLTDVAGPRINITPVAGLPLLHIRQPEFSGPRKWLKHALDVALAALLLVLLAPVFAAVALAVWMDSPGPVLFRQARVGLGGQLFVVSKFRSMYVDAEERLAELRARNEADPDGLLFKVRDDPRVTPVGRWLRRYSLDELPQLWNVLTGDMALVGPRPPLPSEVEQYGSDVRRRLLVKPGITGLWQVSGRSDLSWEDSVRLDLYYVENWSPAMDFLILWKTFFAVVRARGAY